MDNVSLGGAMNGEKPGGGVIVMSQYEEDEDEDGPGRYLAPYERVPVSQNDDEWSVVGTNGKKGAKDEKKAEDPPNYWNNLPVKKPADPDEIVCTTHGKICSRGICTTYAKLKREKKFAEERKKKDEERKLRLKEKKRKEKEKKKEEGSNRGGDGSESEDDDDDDDDSGSQSRKRYNNNNNNGDRRGFGDRKPRYIEPPIRDPKLSTAWATPPPPVANKPDAWSSRAAPSTAARGPQPGDTPTHTYTMANVPHTNSTEPPIRNPKLSTAWATAPPLANKSKEFPPVGSSSTASRTAPSTAWGPKSGDTPTYTYTMPNVSTKPIPQAHVEPSKPVNTSKVAVKKEEKEEEEEEEPKAAIPTLAQYMGDDSDEDDYF
ncbi:hypothetical protein BDN72DRAFT_486853 [Pluteus cervinus]|uniref:Uncharacterized protein n=1 Tax=Pluteus cervinus TaxID=181527 RepID=A0ACD3AZ85_9AGAR|nr:hypothetical protein BDN72DRAFT_486853 [Pluteus cervinus]